MARLPNQHYVSFVNECRYQRIDVPIIPGLRVLTNERQLTSIPQSFHCDIPKALAHEIASTRQHARDIGVAWAVEQVSELISSGAPSVHFFVMANSGAVNAVLEAL